MFLTTDGYASDVFLQKVIVELQLIKKILERKRNQFRDGSLYELHMEIGMSLEMVYHYQNMDFS